METNGFKGIKAERVTDTVYKVLREYIVGRNLPPGSKIHVDQIAKSMNVSRTPVHEALTVLAADGLVEVRPRRGTFVTEFTHDDYVETLDIRRALELLACETGCQRATDADIHKLELLMDEMHAAAAATSDPWQAARIHDAKNLEFHLHLVHLSANKRLIALYEDLRAHLRIARAHLDATSWLERVPAETAEHLAIIHALAKRDADAMKAALDHHLRRSTASLAADIVHTEGRASDRTEARTSTLAPTSTTP